MNSNDYTLKEPLPELQDQIVFMRKTWETLRNKEPLELNDRDVQMIEAILGSLCACKWMID